MTNREIARTIGTTEQVVKNYLRNTFDKLGVWSRLELAIYVAAHGGATWQEGFSTLAADPLTGAAGAGLAKETASRHLEGAWQTKG